MLPGGRAAAAVDPCAAPVVNQVACENTKPGDPPSDWQVNGVGDSTIQGFATSMSVNLGQTIDFKIKTPASAYHIDILRLGYYGGDGARIVASNVKPSASLPQTQPSCTTSSATGLVECGNWKVSASWTVPANAVSGLYVAHLVRNDTGGESQIFFVVRDDSSHSDVVLKTSDSTWQAYNAYGGNSLYTCTVSCPSGNPAGYKAAYAVSYNRPFDGTLTTDNGYSDPLYAEYQLIRFLERNGYDLSYVSQHDIDANGALLKNHKVFVSSGHDEYWSSGERQSVEAARDAGVSLAFFSGNEMFWKTRWAASSDGSNTAYRTLITYKDTHFPAPVDPLAPSVTTSTWRDPRFSPPGDAGRPEYSVTGQYFMVNSGTAEIKVPGTLGKLRFWRNTAVSTLSPSQTLTLAPGTGTLGYEWDVSPGNSSQPRGRIPLSSTAVAGTQDFKDYGTEVEDGPVQTHSLSLYRAPSGALVFGAGTVQWSWGLDVTNPWGLSGPDGSAPDPTMQQATVNLMADMGAQPATLQPGLLATVGSTDTTPPTATVSSPAAGASLVDGKTATISGTASDSGGGVVAAVEVSTDGGSTWHPASGTSSWTYSWNVHGSPSTAIQARAVDDSGNIGAPSAGTAVKVSCPCTIFGETAPAIVDGGDGQSVELGVKFRSEAAGQITGIRFYKATANTGTHIGSLWTSSGTLLAQATFSGESASGWQQVAFTSPVSIQPETTYVAGYLAPKGHYSATEFALNRPPAVGADNLDSPPLHILPDNGNGNGLYQYTEGSVFPTGTYQSENYWVDVTFAPSAPTQPPGQPTGVSATAGSEQATVNWTAPASGGSPTSYRITPYIGASAQTPVTVAAPATSKTITGLTNGTAYTFTVAAINSIGTGPESAASNPVTPAPPNPPGAPTALSASAGNAQATVKWSAPASDGGSPISGYRITPYIGATAQATTTVSGSSTQATLTPLTNGTAYTFTVTAINAAGAGPESAASNPVTPTAPPPSTTIFGQATPGTVDSGDGSSVELGVKFRSEAAGQITGIRFYKATANTGTHIGSLWTSSGTLLAQATFSGESASGWQQVSFTTPVSIQPETTYVAGYLAPKGHYSANGPTLSTGVDSPPLHALANSLSVNGVYAYSSSSTFPTNTFNASNYWVDVNFAPAAPAQPPGQPTGVSATAGSEQAMVNWTAPASGGSPTSYRITPYIGASAQTPVTVAAPATSKTITGLTNGTAYTFTVAAINSIGTGPESAASNPVTPAPPNPPGAPTALSASAGNAQATVKWTAPASDGGSPISGYRITPYIGATAQATTTVSGSSTHATLTPLTNGTAYTFTVTAINAAGAGPESATSNSVTPTGPTPPGAPTAVSASAGSGQATVNWTVPASDGGSAILSYRITPYIGANAQTPVTVAAPATSKTITGLTNGTAYTFTVAAVNSIGTGPESAASNAVTPTAPPPSTTIFGQTIPGTVDSGDGSSVELGVKFRSDIAGRITGIRFYKATANKGTHIGSLWTSSGTLLGQATFSGESASGWQQVAFTSPVSIQPETTYVAGYLAPKGHYSANGPTLSTGVDSPPLHALANSLSVNGVYMYGSSVKFPTNTFNASNYWVDVIFAP